MLVFDNGMGIGAESFRQALWQARHPIALAGAGLSAASGIPTFRGAGDSIRTRLMPSAQSFHLITQNVDGLSGRALEEISQPSEASLELARNSIIEMHGNLFKTICTKCDDVRIDMRQPLSAGLEGTEDVSGDYKRIPIKALPHCTKPDCGGLLRPGVVWFGESIPSLDRIQPLISRCDLILVLGTSSTVYPAAGFADIIKHSNRGKVAVFNIDDLPAAPGSDQEVDWYFTGPVEKILPKVLFQF
uniref:Related to NAD-dependent deacetylase Sirtuin 5 n=1 Tax=Melanopsichium pennsylvanicum 4 TaxID=1398559 RepID=A0A077R041_9BASI|nr:related to NAD-dependent deacetylase Sirtuin 5 [Melanopsichium pennsylvanicum 4]